MGPPMGCCLSIFINIRRVPKCGFVSILTTILLITITLVMTTQAQVVSHELRRLTVATNQFGMDALKALDKIEPPDKVLVFCPVCLSSSLMMIMMGSSKYQVVSSLRQALYVWSMKPQDINRGFKDVFEHIGLNQNYQIPRAGGELSRTPGNGNNISTLADGRADHDEQSSQLQGAESRQQVILKRSFQLPNSRTLAAPLDALSLPKLIKLKEILERAAEKDAVPWWHSMSRRSDKDKDTSESDARRQYQTSTNPRAGGGSGTNTNSSLQMEQRDIKDFSQMSAMSNIYIQRGLTMNYNYNLLLRQYYKTVIHPVDFLRNAEETRQHINSLVAANTESKIKDLVKRGSFEGTGKSTPRIMMISTFHFRGTLDVEMKSRSQAASSNRTRTRRARNDQTSSLASERQQGQVKTKATSFIETEASLLKYGHFASLDCSVIEIPFNNRLVSLVVVMPDNRNVTELLLTRLSAQVLSDLINSLVVKRLSLGIPVIKFDRGPINTSGLLRELGLDHLFFGNQTFSTETGLNRWLRPSDVVHETSIDIGTMNPNWGIPEDRLKVGAHDSRSTESNHINLDKPFFYFVLDSINGLILTMGRIRQ